jgi:choline dehydrogenase-like flavoprotein
MNLKIDSGKDMTYDTIVISSSISGSWAAKELCDKGLKTLVLERGRDVKHVEDYPTAMKNPWDHAPFEGNLGGETSKPNYK